METTESKLLNGTSTTELARGASVGHATFGAAPVIVHRRSSGTIVTFDGAVTGLTATADSSRSGTQLDGIQPLQMNPSVRPIGYTWTVNKWAKKNTDGWAAHVVAAASAGLEMVGAAFGNDGDDEVVFEWVKMRVPPPSSSGVNVTRRMSTAVPSGNGTRTQSKPRSSRPTSMVGEGYSPTRTSLHVPSRSTSPLPPSLPSSPNLDVRPDPSRRLSASTVSTRPNGEHEHETSSIGEDEESDAEDSETPWTCSIWVKKTGHRQLLGTLIPEPHHPMIIATLKVPESFEPISLAQMNTPSAQQQAMARRVKEEVALSEKQLKNVVCITAMWLVGREDFGGLGKKKKV